MRQYLKDLWKRLTPPAQRCQACRTAVGPGVLVYKRVSRFTCEPCYMKWQRSALVF